MEKQVDFLLSGINPDGLKPLHKLRRNNVLSARNIKDCERILNVEVRLQNKLNFSSFELFFVRNVFSNCGNQVVLDVNCERAASVGAMRGRRHAGAGRDSPLGHQSRAGPRAR